jgi:hypothetical protein
MQSLYADLEFQTVFYLPFALSSMPPNCRCGTLSVLSPLLILLIMQSRSEVDDINLGLEHFYGDFNVVHARLISSGVSLHLFLITTRYIPHAAFPDP